MEKTDLMELKKRWKFTDNSISGFSYAIISTEDGVLKTDDRSFFSLSDEEIKKYLSLLGKGYSTAESTYHETLECVGDLDMCFKTLVSETFSEDVLITLAEQIKRNLVAAGYYALLCFRDSYDVPIKDTSKTKTGESDEVYSYCAFLLCPLHAQKGGICYSDNALLLANATPFLQNPVLAMLYPAFTDRSADNGKAFVCAKGNDERTAISELFKVDVPEKPKPQAKIKDTVAPVALTDGPNDNISDDGYAVHTEGYISPDADRVSDTTAAFESEMSESDRGELMKALDDMDERRSKLKDSPSSRKRDDADSSDGYKDLSDADGVGDTATIREDIAVKNVGGRNYYIIPADRIPLDALERLIEENRSE